ncbi:MAG: hypothetical protein ACLVAW_00335 [Eisenbergiella massiliensis]
MPWIIQVSAPGNSSMLASLTNIIGDTIRHNFHPSHGNDRFLEQLTVLRSRAAHPFEKAA